MTVQEWFGVVEDYYGDVYRPTVKKAVWLLVSDISGEARRVLFKILRMNVSNRYKQPPDEIEVRKALKEVAEGYPELSDEAAAIRDPAMQITDGPGIPVEAMHEYAQHLVEKMKSEDTDWKEDPEYHTKWLSSRGYI